MDSREELIAALAPFAAAADHMEKCRDDRPLWAAIMTGWSQRDQVPLTVGDLRRARTALSTPSPEAGSAEAPVATVVLFDPRLSEGFPITRPHKIIDASMAFMDSAALGTPLFARAQNFRAGIEAAAKVIFEFGDEGRFTKAPGCVAEMTPEDAYLLGIADCSVWATKDVEALAPPAGAGEARIPTGWQIVPIIPTSEMLNRADSYVPSFPKDEDGIQPTGYDVLEVAWKVMLENAPQPFGDVPLPAAPRDGG